MTENARRTRVNWYIALCAMIILLVGFAVRLIDLTDPPLDFHASRQLRSAILTRAFYLSSDSIANSDQLARAQELAQLEQYEPPIMEWLVAQIDRVIGLEAPWVGRIFSAFWWMVGGVFLFLLILRVAHPLSALLSLLIYFFLPFSVIASRSFQPDPWMCAWTVITAYFLMRWMEHGHWRWAVAAGLAGGMTLLIKVFSVFFVGMMLLGCFLTMLSGGSKTKRFAQACVIGVGMLLPAGLYYFVFHPSRSSDFFSFWVISLSGLIRTSSFYAGWIAMVKGLMGLILSLLAVWGAFLAERKQRGLLLGWWAGYVLYGLVVPYQMITHEYYSLILVPLAAASLPAVSDGIFKAACQRGKAALIAVSMSALFLAFYGAYAASSALRGVSYQLEPASWKRVGDALPEDAHFVALTSDYGFRLIYYGWRMPDAVWADGKDDALFALAGQRARVFEESFTEQTEGKDFFLVTALGELERQPLLKEKLSEFPVFQEGNGFLIYDLRQ